MPKQELPDEFIKRNISEGIDLAGPGLDLARARAEQLIVRASFSEATKVIDELRAEVQGMQFAARYNTEKKRSLPKGERDEG